MAMIIRTARLTLRPLMREDLPDLVRTLNNLNISRWLARVPYPYTLTDAEDFLSLCATPKDNSLRLAITMGGSVIGFISYEQAEDGISAEFGYWLAQQCWRQGYMREAAEAMVAHAFTEGGQDILISGCFEGNAGSRRILENLGFIPTGQRGYTCRADGQPRRGTAFALARGRWEQLRERHK